MNFRLDIEMDNAAFHRAGTPEIESDTNELVLILIRVGRAIDNGDSAGLARDTNGNTVGNWRIS